MPGGSTPGPIGAPINENPTVAGTGRSTNVGGKVPGTSGTWKLASVKNPVKSLIVKRSIVPALPTSLDSKYVNVKPPRGFDGSPVMTVDVKWPL